MPPKEKLQLKRKKWTSKVFWQNNKKMVGLVTFVIAVNVALFVWWAFVNRTKGPYVLIAKGCAMALNFDCAFILLPICRFTISFLRSTRAVRFLPLDNNIFVHKFMAVLILLLSLVHTVMHLINIGKWEFPLYTAAVEVHAYSRL
jgi:predicted ferric reductase